MQADSKTLDRPVPNGSGPVAPFAAPDPTQRGGPTGGGSDRFWSVLATLRRYPDLAILAALLLLTSILSRTFSQAVSVGPIYVTEVVMALAFAIALTRQGIGTSWSMLRRLPLPALGVIWFVGVIATIRGLEEFGLSQVTHDIGLLDYTLLLPILALVVVDRERHDALYATLVACGFAGMATFVAVFTADQISGHTETLFNLQGSAAALYMSIGVAWIAARLVNGVPTPRWLIALLPVGLVLMSLTGQRSAWFIALFAMASVAAMAPRARRLRTGLAVAVVLPLSIVAALGVQSIFAEVAPVAPTSQGTLDPVLVAPDATSAEPTIKTGGAENRGDGNASTTSNDGGPQLEEEIAGLTNADSEEGQNIRWRLAYWGELVSRVPADPILGAGFGRPADFYWQSRKYDFRDGEPLIGIDVAGPHNSFINFLWRLGIPASLALLFVIGVALARVRTALRSGVSARDRVALTTLAATLAAGAMASSFNEGLTGPFLGLFFWVPLGMLLIWPATRSAAAPGSVAARGT